MRSDPELVLASPHATAMGTRSGPNPIVRGDPTTFGARYALRMRQKLGLPN
jgi:hypothetical protein